MQTSFYYSRAHAAPVIMGTGFIILNYTYRSKQRLSIATDEMEAPLCDIYMTREYVIVSKGPHSLWCSRKDGSLKPGSGTNER